MNFTEEDIQYLKKFESNFNTAIKTSYTRNVPRKDIEKMLDIYNRVNGKTLTICTYCTSSILSFLKDIGQQYFSLVQTGNEQRLNTNELEKEVTYLENTDVAKAKEDNTKECTTTNTNNNDEAVLQRKNKKITKTRNAKYTTK